MKNSVKLLLLFMLFASTAFSKNLTLVKSMTPPNFELLDVKIYQNHMIIPAGLGGAVLFDISDPQAPRSLAGMRPGTANFGRTYNWDMTNNIAIGTSREEGFAIYNIRKKTQPLLLTTHNPNNDLIPNLKEGSISVEDVEMTKNYAVFASHSHGLLIYDISKPSSPRFYSQVLTQNAWSLAIHGNRIYVADGEGGLKIVNIDEIAVPYVMASVPTSGSARDVRFADGHVFLAVGAAGVDVFDVTSSSDPKFIANHKTAGFASRIALNGNLIATSAWNRVEVIEWTGSSLDLVGYKNTGGRVMAVGWPDGDHFYSAEWQILRVFKYGEINDPDIDVSARLLKFKQLEIGESDTLQLGIENNGKNPLNIQAFGITSSDFTVEPQPSRLLFGEKALVDVIYSASSTTGGGTLQIASNDPDESSLLITLEGNTRRSVAVGKPAADFTLPILANGSGTMSLSQLKGKVVVLALFASW